MDSELISRINTALIESGDRERLKQLVKNKLEESGWFKVMKEEADSIIIIILGTNNILIFHRSTCLP